MSWMVSLQNGAVYFIILIFLGIIGKEMYSRWEESNIVRKHNIQKLKQDLAKEE